MREPKRRRFLPVLRLTRWVLGLWYRVSWRADAAPLSGFLVLLLAALILVSSWLDRLAWPLLLVRTLVPGTNNPLAPLVVATWKWLCTALPFGLAVVSFSHSVVKEVSLSLTFTGSPRGRRLLGLFCSSLLYGLIQIARDSWWGRGSHVVGDFLFLCLLAATIWVTVSYLGEQFRRLSPRDEYEYLRREVLRLVTDGVERCRSLAGEAGVSERLNLAAVNVETMFQIADGFVRRDMDVYYDEHYLGLPKTCSAMVRALQAVRLGQAEYGAKVRFLTSKYMDHALALSEKRHGPESMRAIDHCFAMLLQARAYDELCLVECVMPIRAAILSALQRGDRAVFMWMLAGLGRLHGDSPPQALAIAVGLVYRTVLLEAMISGDRMALNEVLFRIHALSGRLDEPLAEWLYSGIWEAALKAIEHSAHVGLGALIKTFVSVFEPERAVTGLDRMLREYGKAEEVRQTTPPISLADLDEDVRIRVRTHLDALDPRHEFIEGSLEYCLEKLVVLWFGQQLWLASHGALRYSRPLFPQAAARLPGRNLAYLEHKLVSDAYGLAWTSDPRFLANLGKRLREEWGLGPTGLADKTGLYP